MPDIKFIHIGKCGGSYLRHFFKKNKIGLDSIHLKKPVHKINNKYIIFVRNPLSRFVSAFNYLHSIVNFDATNLDVGQLSLENCPAPVKIRKKMLTGFAYNQEFDYLVNSFESANDLAECITHEKPETRSRAIKLMNYNIEHINKGIGWYLDNGEFILKYEKSILFVGKQESMISDLTRLMKLLDLDINIEDKRIRENKNNRIPKSLSPLAIGNLLDFYKGTDYLAIEKLYQAGMLSKETFLGYQDYSD
ncbi:MAG: sulfotransferase family 2 domain-containing protein [Methylococcales bacterium]